MGLKEYIPEACAAIGSTWSEFLSSRFLRSIFLSNIFLGSRFLRSVSLSVLFCELLELQDRASFITFVAHVCSTWASHFVCINAPTYKGYVLWGGL
jgi:hypothetical protein